MPVAVSSTNRISLDASFSLGIQRTLRIPDDGNTYPLPPALGRLPVHSVVGLRAPLPDAWRDGTHVLVPMHRREAAWLQFRARLSEPRAIKIGVGNINALTGAPWNETLHASPQDYVVCPYQPWLDGFKVGRARVRQFVAVPLNAQLTVEQQLTGHDTGGIRVASFAPDPSIPLRQPRSRVRRAKVRDLGLGAGGQIDQRVYPDPYGLDMWLASPSAVVHIHLLEVSDYSRLTGEDVPSPPIDAATYARYGLPWFELYDSPRGDLVATNAMSQLLSVDEISTAPNRPSTVQQRPVDPPLHVRPIPPRSRRRR